MSKEEGEVWYTFKESQFTGGYAIIRISRAEIIEYMKYRGFTSLSYDKMVDDFKTTHHAVRDTKKLLHPTSFGPQTEQQKKMWRRIFELALNE
ncbi:MAG: hypothetical protein KAI07_00645 [Deltaproteobacteria bacterium]|nr:hypothetical protein [Deltaproteobacteria bacterium]